MALLQCTQRESPAKRNVRYHGGDDWNDRGDDENDDDWNDRGDDEEHYLRAYVGIRAPARRSKTKKLESNH